MQSSRQTEVQASHHRASQVERLVPPGQRLSAVLQHDRAEGMSRAYLEDNMLAVICDIVCWLAGVAALDPLCLLNTSDLPSSKHRPAHHKLLLLLLHLSWPVQQQQASASLAVMLRLESSTSVP